MFRAVPLIVVSLLFASSVTSAANGEEVPSLPGWLAARLDERGIEVDAGDVRVMRTVTVDGVSMTFEVPFDALVQTDPFEGAQVAPVATPEVLAGDMQLHIMLQFDCAGYGAQPVAAGLQSIQDAKWDLGVHVALGPLSGGRAVGTGAGVENTPSNLVAIANVDHGMRLAAGQFSTTYDRITFFGICLLGIGQMTGTGAWVWS